jgi:hypothetical protein
MGGVPTDGHRLPIERSGDFGASPFLRQLSAKLIRLTLRESYTVFDPVSRMRMSAVGQTRRFEAAPCTSALPPTPDVLLSRSKRRRRRRSCRFRPPAAISLACRSTRYWLPMMCWTTPMNGCAGGDGTIQPAPTPAVWIKPAGNLLAGTSFVRHADYFCTMHALID